MSAPTSVSAEQAPPAAAMSGAWLTLAEVVEAIASDPKARVAISISGGGASGAYEAGMLNAYLTKASAKAGALPKVIVGSSAGALNSVVLLVEQTAGGSTNGQLGVELWKTIDAGRRGADFVVGSRAWLVRLLTGGGWRMHAVGIAGALLALATLLIWLAARRWGLLALIPSAAILVAAVAAALLAVRYSLFGNMALRRTIANTCLYNPSQGSAQVSARMLMASPRVEAAGRHIIGAWYQKLREVQDYVFTTTDLTAGHECLFTIASDKTLEALDKQEWPVVQLAPPSGSVHPPVYPVPRVDAERFVDIVLASTSIPGVFPSRRVDMIPASGTDPVTHELVDGGVLNNCPIHVAIDCGATHVISVELDPLTVTDPLKLQARGRSLSLAHNLVETFATLLQVTTRSDIRVAAAWNRQIARGVPTPDKRQVEIYRFAPTARRIGTIEFDGHFKSGANDSDYTLGQWLAQGEKDASTERLFWRATFEAEPSQPPPSENRISGSRSDSQPAPARARRNG